MPSTAAVACVRALGLWMNRLWLYKHFYLLLLPLLSFFKKDNFCASLPGLWAVTFRQVWVGLRGRGLFCHLLPGHCRALSEFKFMCSGFYCCATWLF